jgi:uncharacterized protein (TIGR03382 family)
MSVASAGASADVVTENESSGQARNNSLSTAQLIGAGSFTINADPNVFGVLATASVRGVGGGNDVDFYTFGTGGGSAYFDIDGTSGGFDSYLALFDASGTLIADNDDSFPGDAGSMTDLDAFLGVVNLSAGQYFLAVAGGGNTARASFTGDQFVELFRPDGAFGGFAFGNADAGESGFLRNGVQGQSAYTLHVSIPTPGGLAVAGMVVGWMGRRRR